MINPKQVQNKAILPGNTIISPCPACYQPSKFTEYVVGPGGQRYSVRLCEIHFQRVKRDGFIPFARLNEGMMIWLDQHELQIVENKLDRRPLRYDEK